MDKREREMREYFERLHRLPPTPAPNGGVPIVTSRTERMTFPHYSDKRFKDEARILFQDGDGKGRDGAYDNRLREWDSKAWSAGWQSAVDKGLKPRTAAFYDELLSVYYGRPIVVRRVDGDYNRMSGHPVYYLRWDEAGGNNGTL